MEFQISLEGRTVPTMLVWISISSLKEQPAGPQGEDIIKCGLKLYLVKVTATEVDIGLVIISLSPESLGKTINVY